ncbi:MAG: hypothetical protein EOP85_04275 [Verrucomicrobiaceae bacterium]|nr:MAG: hypothetical protein EOP85_04275 [Verrucomicrobiaceae bacterium]
MKKLLIALPLLLLVAVLAYQGRSHDPAKKGEPPSLEPRFDWTGIRKELEAENLGGRVDESSAYGRYLSSLETMDGPALIAAWDELKASHLPGPVAERLEPSLLGTLMRKDVELALVRFASHVGDPPGGISSQLFNGFRDLSERLPLKAAQWLDQNVAAGNFGTDTAPMISGDTPVRVTYERELIRSLLRSGPDRAEARLMALPEKWRIMTLAGSDSPQGQPAYGMLVRKFMGPEQQQQEFMRMATSAAYHGGADGVAQLLDRISATADERENIIRGTPIPPGSGNR